MKTTSVIGVALIAGLLSVSTLAKKQYQPSEKVLNKMMEIELERYQNMFGGEEKQRAKHEISLSQTASIIEASAGYFQESDQPVQETKTKKRISSVFNARGTYIANTL